MFKQKIVKLCVLSTLYSLLSTLCFAQAITSTNLIQNAKDYDAKQVVYEGEVVGDIMKRGEFIWLNVNDGENAIGVHCNIGLIDTFGDPAKGGVALSVNTEYTQVKSEKQGVYECVDGLELFAGGYNHRGDWVKITGVFNQVCKIHGGDLDIHADKIELIKKGKPLSDQINLQKQKLVYKLAGVLLCLLILRLLVARLRRRSRLATT